MGQSFNAPYEAIGEELLSQLVDTFMSVSRLILC